MLQTLLLGKIATSLVLASAAYRPLPLFKQHTGLNKVQLLVHPPTDTTVLVLLASANLIALCPCTQRGLH